MAEILAAIGIALALTGIGLLVRVIRHARAVLRGTADDADATFRRMMVENFAALGLAAVGLVLIVVSGLV